MLYPVTQTNTDGDLQDSTPHIPKEFFYLAVLSLGCQLKEIWRHRLRNEDFKKRVKSEVFLISSIRLWCIFSTFQVVPDTVAFLCNCSLLASFLRSSLSICSKIFQCLATLFQLQDFRLGKSKTAVAILDVARVDNGASQYSPLCFIQEQNTPVWLQVNPKKKFDATLQAWVENVLHFPC